MKNVTLKFPRVREMLEFIRLSHIGSFECSASTQSLTADLSTEEMMMARTLGATLADGHRYGPGATGSRSTFS